MKHHLTEQDFIEYRFELASESRGREIAAHLEGCEGCREGFEQLKLRFSALDLLGEDVGVSEELISKALEQAKQAVPVKLASYRKPAWLSAAAAVLVAGLVLLFSQPSKEPARPREVSVQPKPEALGMITPSSLADGGSGRPIADDAEAIAEKPPFAPASAIELVVLPRRDETQLTIYNSADLTLVRDKRKITLKRGWNWLQFMWANTLIDPTSLALEPLEQKDKVNIEQLVFPARLRELGRWLIRSEVSGQVPFEITYFTSGLSWRAFYMGTLSQDEKTMRLQGYVRLANNSGEDYPDAQTRLIVGKVHILDQISQLARRQHPYGSPIPMREPPGMDLSGGSSSRYGVGGDGKDGVTHHVYFGFTDIKEIKKEGLSEYFLYTIEGRETIPDKWGKRLESFDVNDIEVKSLYKYDEERYGRQTTRFVTFENDEEHNLGDTPIPNGAVKIYRQADEDGYLSYVGGTNIKYIPVNEEVELNLGAARLVAVEPTLMDFKTANYIFDSNRDIAGWDEIRTWKIEIANTRTLAIDIEITRGFGTNYWSLGHSDGGVSYEKHDASHARFKTTVGPRSKRVFDYTVTTYHGRRQEESRR